MFLSETVLRAIQADRAREIERMTRGRRLLDGPARTAVEPLEASYLTRPASPTRPAARPGRTRLAT